MRTVLGGTAAPALLVLVLACGGTENGTDDGATPDDRPDIVITLDTGHDEGPVAPDVPDTPDADVDEEEVTPPQCSTKSVAIDCAEVCAGIGECQECICNVLVDRGTCQVVARGDGYPCDDGDDCTTPDTCQEGACAGGTRLCECQKNSDCPATVDKCGGTAFCNKTNFPYKCDIDLSTAVKCPGDQNTFCRANQCDPETGLCGMRPANEGEPCILQDRCALKIQCVEGECQATESTDCNDDNPCTDDSCDPVLGCVRIPNAATCDDGNACTVGDHCENTWCTAGELAPCDDLVYCNGVETCDEVAGCVAGTPPTCNDGKVCTDDRCDVLLDQCVNDQLPDAVEGPMGTPSCGDGIDNDCDGKSDEGDGKCSFKLLGLTPADGPETGGTPVVLTGTSLDLVKKVLFGTVETTTFTATATTLRVAAPPHDLGVVDITVWAGPGIEATLPAAFTYTGLAGDPTVVAAFLGPLDPVTLEQDEWTPSYSARVSATGITDVASPDPTLIKAQFGWGFQYSHPWEDPSWRWVDVTELPAMGDGWFTYDHSWPLELGGRFNVAARFSKDGGLSWTYADSDGSDNGWDAGHAPLLSVLGRALPGQVVLNEIAWSGSAVDANDEWIELRNLTQAPIKLAGWKITGAGYPTGREFVFEASPHVVNNLVLEPYGYYLIAQLEQGQSVRDVTADIVALPTPKTMRLPNSGPWTFKLIDNRNTTIDIAAFTGALGQAGDVDLKVPSKTMERRQAAADGTKDPNWLTSFIHEGFKGDPRQAQDYGTPRAPNSDIGTCAQDDECQGMFPTQDIAACEKRACGLFQGPPSVGKVPRCTILNRADGDECTNGVFCVVSETCTGGKCGSGKPRDCADSGPDALCTADRCDEPSQSCLHDPDPYALEGPGTSTTCGDTIDNDCDGVTDLDDPQCLLRIDGVSPAVVPMTGGWEVQVSGGGFDIATGLTFGSQAAEFTLDGPGTMWTMAPGQPAAADVSVKVTDGFVTATWSGKLRCIGKADEALANLQWPTDPLQMYVGETTPQIYGRIFWPGFTDAGGDPGTLIAEIGAGGLGTDPFEDTGWTWSQATWNGQCMGCPAGVYEYGAVLKVTAPGTLLVGFRFSRDGIRWQYGDIGPLSNDWNPEAGLKIRVDEAF